MQTVFPEWLAKLLDVHPSPLVAWDDTGQFIHLNRVAEQVLLCHVDSDSREALVDEADESIASNLSSGDVSSLLHWLNDSASLVKHSDDEKSLVIQFADEELTEMSGSEVGTWEGVALGVLLEEWDAATDLDLLHRLRLETLGTLAGGIAHDFNNLLAGILGHVTFLQTVLPGKGDHVESIEAIADGAKRASTMTQQILDFSRLHKSSSVEEVDIVQLIDRTSLLLRGALRSAQSLELFPAKHERIIVKGNEGKLAQVLVNLVINARDAIDQQGVIEIRSGVDAGGQAFIAVSDNGCGIPDVLQGRVFQPFFSTKGPAGTGLGLATSKSIMEEFGGTISIESKLGEGTSISLFFPEAQVGDGVQEEDERQAPIQGQGQLILVVDDEPPVRNVLEMSLNHLGYSVEVFANGADAIEFFGENHERVALVILDMLMPGMSGEQVFFKLRELIPTSSVLIMSGYSSRKSIENVLSHGAKGFIQKPFAIEELARQVSDCLAEEQSGSVSSEVE